MYGSLAPDSQHDEALQQHQQLASPEKRNNNNNYHSMKWKLLGFVMAASIGSLLVFSNDKSRAGAHVRVSQLERMGGSSSTNSNDKLSSLSTSEKGKLFDSFKQKFNVMYGTIDEESERYQNFENFLQIVDEMNEAEKAAGGSAVHGVTRFADMSTDEFKKNFLGFKPSSDKTELLKLGKSGSSEVETTTSSKEKKSESNWVGVYTTPVKDQGYCGSCWAFSTIQQIESDAIRKGYLTTDDWLSPQQLVSCDTTDLGCDGGVPVYAYKYVKDNGGITTNSTYPYQSYLDRSGKCHKVDDDDLVVTVSTFYFLDSEAEMQEYVLNTGPLSVCVDASSWATYTGGVLATCTDEPNHCVQIVGVNKEEDYWLVRNSWGTSWGEDGYIRMKLGKDLCGITYIPTYVSTQKV